MKATLRQRYHEFMFWLAVALVLIDALALSVTARVPAFEPVAPLFLGAAIASGFGAIINYYAYGRCTAKNDCGQNHDRLNR